MRSALATIDAFPHEKCLRFDAQPVGQQIATQKAAAGCEPSGWRNSHIACLYVDGKGPQALIDWCSVLSQGKISSWTGSGVDWQPSPSVLQDH